MAVRKLTTSTIENNVWYKSMLAGNSAYIPNSYELIQTVFGTGSSGTIEFTSIPQDYKHLQLRLSIRHADTSSALVEDCSIRLNGATSGYSIHRFSAVNASVTQESYASQSSMWGASTNAPAGTANVYAPAIIDILDYATSKLKTIRSLHGTSQASTARVILDSGTYHSSTGAITSIQIISPNTSTKPFEQNARFSLYGIRG